MISWPIKDHGDPASMILYFTGQSRVESAGAVFV